MQVTATQSSLSAALLDSALPTGKWFDMNLQLLPTSTTLVFKWKSADLR